MCYKLLAYAFVVVCITNNQGTHVSFKFMVYGPLKTAASRPGPNGLSATVCGVTFNLEENFNMLKSLMNLKIKTCFKITLLRLLDFKTIERRGHYTCTVPHLPCARKSPTVT